MKAELDAALRFVSIPQAVSTVATQVTIGSQPLQFLMVSIPQAVSTVATYKKVKLLFLTLRSFNTASGKYCCNYEAIQL